MTGEFAVIVDGDALTLLTGLDRASRQRAASQALNKIAASTRTKLARAVKREVNLPASYVAPADKRLYVSGFAGPNALEATITARGRATSLARFVTSASPINQPGVSVNVNGSVQTLKEAFLIRLPGAGGNTDPGNLGLAVRLPKGARLRNKSATRVSKGLYLLYGPSVAQVLENNAGSGVKADILPEVAADLEREYLRLIARSCNA